MAAKFRKIKILEYLDFWLLTAISGPVSGKFFQINWNLGLMLKLTGVVDFLKIIERKFKSTSLEFQNLKSIILSLQGGVDNSSSQEFSGLMI